MKKLKTNKGAEKPPIFIRNIYNWIIIKSVVVHRHLFELQKPKTENKIVNNF